MASGVEENDPKDLREGLLLLAQCAMNGKNYRYMLEYMKKLIEIVMPAEDLSEDERNCFRSACELFLDGHLNPWHHLAFAAADVSASFARRGSAKEYQELIAGEISESCKEIVEFIDRSVLFASEGAAGKGMTTESRVFYKKMKGDYLGHVAMVKKRLEKAKAVEAVLEAYNAAMEEALKLPETNLTRLKLALSLAKFHAEICESFNKACSAARGAVDMAKQSLESKGAETTSEINGVLEQLQSNINIWMDKIVNVTSQNYEDSQISALQD